MSLPTALILLGVLVLGAYALGDKRVNIINADNNNAPSVSKTTASNKTTQNTAKEETCDKPADIQKSKVGIELPAYREKSGELIIKHTGHTLAYNTKHNTPDWVAWSLTKEHTDGVVERSSKFWADEQIDKRYRVDYYEYKGSGYDRGHMCPAGDNKWSEKAMHDCFYMSNMCPQEPSLNSGSWKHLEEKCRDWAIAEGRIYIVCGPIWRGKSHEKIGIDHSIDVPEAFFKAVLSMKKGHEKTIAFIYENNNSSHQTLPKTARSVDDVEKITGLDLFTALDDAMEEKLESSFSLNDWK